VTADIKTNNAIIENNENNFMTTKNKLQHKKVAQHAQFWEYMNILKFLEIIQK